MKKLTNGMRLDELPVDQLPGSWSYAKNISVFKRFGAISNEDGVDDITPVAGGAGTDNYPSTKRVIGQINTNKDKILFFGTTNPADSEIGRIKSDGKYYPIIRDSILGFNQNNPIQGTFENKFNNNTIIAWKDPYLKLLNIDCIPFGIDPTTYAVVSGDINKAKVFLNLFPTYTTPRIDEYFLQVKEGQGALTTGSYYPIVSYELLDGTLTSWGKIYNGVPIFSSNTNAITTTISGGMAGDPTNKGIEIIFKNIDTNYKRIRVGYLYINGGVTTAKLEKVLLITSSTMKVLLTGNNTTTMTLDEVLVPNQVYTKAKSITSLQKQLKIAQPEEPSFYNYQTRANLITVKWVRERIVSIQNNAKSVIDSSGNMVTDGTYQDGTKVFFDKSFKSGEAYALYIGLNFKSGIKSRFHIPGRAFISGDRDIINSSNPAVYNALDGGNPIYKYQILNTTTISGAPYRTGNMGFWENEDEQYPLDPNNPSNVHPDFSNIPGVTSTDRKVRHHLFPDLTILDKTLGHDRFLEGAFEADTFPTPFTYPTKDLNSRAFGIEVSNVNIPSDLLPLIDSWEIFYALRDNSNIRIIGNDCTSESSAAARSTFQLFDLMVNKASLFPTYLKDIAHYVSKGTPAGQETNFIEYAFSSSSGASGIYPVTEFKYLGENTTVPYNNSNRADNISIVTQSGILGTIDPLAAVSSQDTYLYDFCIYKRNIYLNFNTQTLVSTGIVNTITASGVQSSKKIYGGDVYICRHSVIPTSTGTKYMSYICESASNIGLRNEDISQLKYFAPKYANPTPSWYGYNSDFNCINSFDKTNIYYPPDNCTDQNITMHPFRVASSITEGTENSSINWRVFKVNSYYDMPNNKGEIWNILGNDRTLYIHHKYTLFIAEIKDKLSTTESDVYLGNTEVFSRPPIEALPVTEGFAGTQSQFACIVSKVGYSFIDREQGKTFIVPFGTYKPIEISEQGMYGFFSDNSQTSDENIDNPFIGAGYMSGFNMQENKLIICKKDDDGYSFTLSYSPDLNNSQGAWICFHDYSPHCLISSRTSFIAINNDIAKVFKHGSSINISKFYDGTTKNSYIDVVFNDSPEISKKFENVNWISSVELNNIIYKKETATHLMVYNHTQCSGIISLTPANTTWYSRDVRNLEDSWNFNKFRDLIKDVSLPFLDENFDLISSNVNNNKSWFDKSVFISKFVIFRIINDNVSQKNLHISLVGSNLKKSDR